MGVSTLKGYAGRMSHSFADRLEAAIAVAGSPVCVGLDPVIEKLPAELRELAPALAIETFSVGVLDSIRGVIPAVKIQSACFERFGAAGFGAMERVMAHASRLGLVILWDSKRGDIGTTCDHYAAAAVHLGAHAITLNGYLGASGIMPFLNAGLGVFVLVRTSNPDSDAVQGMRLTDGRTIAESMADMVAALGQAHVGGCGLSSVGAVVGATKAADSVALRARMPQQFFLIPGYGAQGGTAADIVAMRRSDGRGILVTASRSVLYPAGGTADWRRNVEDAARSFATEVAGALSRG